MLVVPKRNKKIKQFLFNVILISSLFLIGYSVYGLWVQYTATHQTPVKVQPGEVITNSTDAPDETPPICEEGGFSASQPRYIKLPSIGASGCIQKVGIDQRNSMAVPSNIHLAGWYVNSELPGQDGLSIIDGHSGGRYLDGIFKHLVELKNQDKFTVEFGDKSIKTFEVVSITNYGVNEAAKKMLERDYSIKKQLNLITCGSDYKSSLRGYADRVLVVAKSIDRI